MDSKSSLRNNVIAEIIATEKNYVNKLQLVLDVIIRPLQASLTLSQEDFKSQFGSWETLCSLHSGLYERMVAEQNPESSAIGKVFTEYSSYLNMYGEYLANFDVARSRRGYLLTNNRKFSEILDKFKDDPRTHGLGVEAYLIEPVQRIPRYRLLLEQLIKYTPDNHPEYKILGEALEKISNVATKVNEAIRKRENQDKVMEVMLSFEPITRINLFDGPERVLIKEGDLFKQCRRKRKEFRYWLFSDILLYGEPTGLGSYKVNRVILLEEMRITRATDHFIIESKAKSFETYAKSNEDMNDWYSRIFEAMTAKQKNGLKTDLSPIWTPNQAISSCEICKNAFSLLNRRHHCRRCGILVCDSCSSSRCMVTHVDPNNPVRVCDRCVADISPALIKRDSTFRMLRTPSIFSDQSLLLKSESKGPSFFGLLRGKSEVESPSNQNETSRSPSSEMQLPSSPPTELSTSSQSPPLEQPQRSSSSRRSNILTANSGILFNINREVRPQSLLSFTDNMSDSDSDDDDDDDEPEVNQRVDSNVNDNEISNLPAPPPLPTTRPPIPSLPSSMPPPVPIESSILAHGITSDISSENITLDTKRKSIISAPLEALSSVASVVTSAVQFSPRPQSECITSPISESSPEVVKKNPVFLKLHHSDSPHQDVASTSISSDKPSEDFVPSPVRSVSPPPPPKPARRQSLAVSGNSEPTTPECSK